MIVGIIDSGLGAINLLNHLLALKKHAKYILFLDYAFAPYGNKSIDKLKDRLLIGVNFLKTKGCEQIIIACNTLSIVAESLTLEVITPIFYVNRAIKDNHNMYKTLATNFTIKSKVYGNDGTACGELVDYIEGKKSLIPEKYNFVFNNYRSLILGCTHFSLVKKRFKSSNIIDSTYLLASNINIIPSKLEVIIYVTKINKNIKNHILFYLHLNKFKIYFLNNIV